MLSQRGMFMRSAVGELLGSTRSMGLDTDGRDLLTEGERATLKKDCACKSRALDVTDHPVTEDCVNGMRVLARSDADNSPTSAEVCDSKAAAATGHPVGTQLTAQQMAQLGTNLASLFQGIGGALAPKPAPPPPDPSIIPGVPNFVTLGGAALVVLVVIWRVVKK